MKKFPAVDETKLGPVDNRHSKKSVLRTLPYAAVQITDRLWATYQNTNHNVSLLHGFSMLEAAGTSQILRIAAGLRTLDDSSIMALPYDHHYDHHWPL